jgi:hypothetical protein
MADLCYKARFLCRLTLETKGVGSKMVLARTTTQDNPQGTKDKKVRFRGIGNWTRELGGGN